MAITETVMALGSWSIRLRANTPKEILNALVPFGHVVVMPGRLDVKAAGDGLLRAARYVGVYRSLFAQPEDYEIKGPGMAFWLGDEDNKGYVFRESITTMGAPPTDFTGAINRALPPAGPGRSFAIGSVYPPTPDSAMPRFNRNLKTPRDILNFVCSSYGTDVAPVEWRVNGDATVDAGVVSGLYPSTSSPTALLVRRDGGKEIGLSTVEGSMSLDTDATDFTSNVVLVAEGTGGGIAYGSASAALNPYKDLFGNRVVLTRVVSESDVSASAANTRAQVNLNDYIGLRYASQLSTDEYDVKGTFQTGDTIYVHDVDAGFVDPGVQVMYHGVPLNPRKLRVTEMTWPVPAWWTVAYRDPDGVWYDLSDYYAPEGGSTSVTVGKFLENLSGAYQEPIGSRPSGDTSVPNTPVFGTATTSAYQSDTSKTGDTKAQVNLTWALPTNSDGSTIVDGAYYRLRYRAKFATGSDWTETVVSWGTNQTVVTELTPGTTYSFQIRAEDLAVPPNVSAWSSSLDVVSAFDAIAPSTPAAPAVAASRISIQVTHTLGKASGGTYNLETDLDHLEVHSGASAGFSTGAGTLLGRMTANVGLMQAGIAAVQTFNVETIAATWIKVVAVDRSGNKSTSSTGASATALLIDTAHISDLSVSKVTAGTIAVTWLVGGTITTASSGARMELAASGLNAYNSGGTKTVEIKGSDGSATITGVFKTGYSGGGSSYLQMTDSGDRTTIDFFNPTASAGLSAYMNSPVDGGNSAQIGVNSGTFNYTTGVVPSRHRLFLANGSGIYLQTVRVATGIGDVGGRLFLTDAGSGITTYSEAGTGTQTGGQLLLNKDLAALSRKGSGVLSGAEFLSTVDAGKMGVYNTGTIASEIALFDDESIWVRGRFSADNPQSGKSALFVGTWDAGSATSFTVNYGATMSTTPRVVYSIHKSSGTGPTSWLSTQSATGFTVEISSATALRLNYWGFRLI